LIHFYKRKHSFITMLKTKIIVKKPRRN